jgi:hypothetical protein
MGAISEQLIRMELVGSAEGIARLSEDEATSAFTAAIAALMEQMKPGATRRRGRWTEMSIPTLYQHVLDMRKERKRRREQEAEAINPQSDDSNSERPAQMRRLGL